MKLHKYYTKEPYSFLVDDTICYHIINYDLRRTLYKMTITEKIKTIDKKIKQNKDEYDFDHEYDINMI